MDDLDAIEVYYNLKLKALYYIRFTLAELCETTDESFDSLFAFTNGIAATYERLFLEGAPTSIGEATSRIDSITMRVNEIHKERGWDFLNMKRKYYNVEEALRRKDLIVTAHSVNYWWETVDFYEIPGIIPTLYFIIRCKRCGAEYDTKSLQVVPMKCPDCGKKSEG